MKYKYKPAALAFYIVLLAAVFAGCTAFGASGTSLPEHLDGPAVSIYVGNDLYDTVPFGEPQVITVEQEDGSLNEITITEDSVYMSHATCKNQDCLLQGEITVENYTTRLRKEWIICLPNKVTIEFVMGDDA